VHSRYLNGVKTAMLLALLAGLLMLAGYLIGGTQGLVIGFGIALLTNGFAYWNSGKIALRAMHAYPVTPEQQPAMYRIVQDLSTQAGQPMPTLYVSPTDAPNAFATGRNPANAAVCCTEGILRLLNERELRGVLGHELSHVYNRDILTASIAATLAAALMFLAQFAFFFGGSRDERQSSPFGAILVLILGPLAAGVIQMAISRSREYAADESGAELAHDPLALASALRRLEQGTNETPLRPDPELQTASALMIANPFRMGTGGMANLFSTHPPMDQRIARLEEMAAEGGYPPA
jgi:heat shock protein HtpX